MPKIINGDNDTKLIIGGKGGMYDELKAQKLEFYQKLEISSNQRKFGINTTIRYST